MPFRTGYAHIAVIDIGASDAGVTRFTPGEVSPRNRIANLPTISLAAPARPPMPRRVRFAAGAELKSRR